MIEFTESENEEKKIMHDYKYAYKDKYAKKREKDVLKKFLAVLFIFSIFLYFFPKDCQAIQYTEINSYHYYKAGILNIHRIIDVLSEFNNKYLMADLQASVKYHLIRFDSESKQNEQRTLDLHQDMLEIVRIYYNQKADLEDINNYWEEIEKYLNGAAYCFKIFDKR